MDEKLKAAAAAGDINQLYTSIQEDPYVLDRIDHQPFVESPLHVAASLGHTQFAMEIMRLRPSFAKKPNLNGFTPLHLALQDGVAKMVYRLVVVDSDLVRVRGREGKTPLHYAAEEGSLELLKRFLSLCPLSILDVTIRNETALHIAVRNYKFDAFDFLVGTLRRAHHRSSKIQEKEILNWEDEEGNTVLHIAVLTNQPKVVRVLRECGVELNSQNSEGLTALDISQVQVQEDNTEVRKMLRFAGASNASSLPSLAIPKTYLLSKVSFMERLKISIVRYKKSMTSDTLNVQLVVAVLIATATYQATLGPPGGLRQDDNKGTSVPSQAGKVIMGPQAFLCFWIFNTTALLTTAMAILFLIPTGYLSTLLITPLCLVFLLLCFVNVNCIT